MLVGTPKYISDSIKNPKRIIKKINNGKLSLGYHVITFAKDPEQLDIIPSYVLMQQVYQEMDIEVVGLAKDLDSAYELVAKMTQDALDKTGDCNIKSFLMNNQVG